MIFSNLINFILQVLQNIINSSMNTVDINGKEQRVHNLNKLKWQQFKSKRNNSLPNLNELTKEEMHRSQHKFKYNKWFIKPELRLKTNLDDTVEQKQNLKNDLFFYETLYKPQPQASPSRNIVTNSDTNKTRFSLAQSFCADLYNFKVIHNFKNKKQVLKRRIPGMIDYFLNFKEQQEDKNKKQRLRKRRIYI